MKANILKKIEIGCGILYLLFSFFSLMSLNYYHMFAHLQDYSFFLILFQWLKITALLVIPLGLFFHKDAWRRVIQYFFPFVAIGSLCVYKEYFSIYKIAETPQQEIYNQINFFLPQKLLQAFYIIEAILIIGISILIWVQEYNKIIKGKDALKYLFGIILVTPLNILDNFVRILPSQVQAFLKFKNFTIWHFLAFIFLFLTLYILYQWLKKKDRETQYYYLQVLAIVGLIHYHCKMSIIMGDGYNVYYTIFACIPLFICNIGEYVAALSVFTKKKIFYNIAFFIHAVGALSVFVYFGRDEMSNFGTIFNYSFLYFCATHIFLFNLCLLPILLGHFTFKLKECKIPLLYYAVVIVIASFASALVTNFSSTLVDSTGAHLETLIYPNYAFTQINPLPIEVPNILSIHIGVANMNVLYIVLVYGFYLLLFFSFYFAQKYAVILYKKWVRNKSTKAK